MLCDGGEPLIGLALHDISQYAPSARETVRETFGMADGHMAVLAVAKDGPAARAGLLADDILLAVDGAALSLPHTPPSPSTLRRDAALDQIDRALSDGGVVFTVSRKTGRQSFTVQAVQGCASRVEIVPGNGMNAGADGRTISIDGRLVNFVEDDDELAAIIAHEMAHNIRNHRPLLDSLGVRGGLLSVFGKNPARIRCTEEEADYVGTYLMARAGFDPAAATRFWERFGKRGLPACLGDPTHPRPQDRRSRIAAAINEISALKTSNQPLVPRLDPAACRE